MKIGFIVGRNDEICNDKLLYSKTPKKYLVNNELHVDVAIAMTVKLYYDNIKVDIIKPNELSITRLKKNDVNFPLGYDIINYNIGVPYVKKFNNDSGYNKLLQIYKSKNSKIFPPYKHLEFIWNKDKYMKYYKNKIPINPTIIVNKNKNIQTLIKDIQSKKWNTFIIKPIGATTADGFTKFILSDKDLYIKLNEYFDSNYYSKFLIQELINGFTKYGEIRMYWIDNKYSYSVNTIDKGYEYIVKPVTNKDRLSICKSIGETVIDKLPPIIINNKKIKPVMIRTDMVCCLNNNPLSSNQYYLNELEYQDAGTFTNFENINYPIVKILADTFVKKSYELKSIKF